MPKNNRAKIAQSKMFFLTLVMIIPKTSGMAFDPTKMALITTTSTLVAAYCISKCCRKKPNKLEKIPQRFKDDIKKNPVLAPILRHTHERELVAKIQETWNEFGSIASSLAPIKGIEWINVFMALDLWFSKFSSNTLCEKELMPIYGDLNTAKANLRDWRITLEIMKKDLEKLRQEKKNIDQHVLQTILEKLTRYDTALNDYLAEKSTCIIL